MWSRCLSGTRKISNESRRVTRWKDNNAKIWISIDVKIMYRPFVDLSDRPDTELRAFYIPHASGCCDKIGTRRDTPAPALTADHGSFSRPNFLRTISGLGDSIRSSLHGCF